MTIWTIEQEQRFLELRCMEAVTLETDPKLTELHKLREQLRMAHGNYGEETDGEGKQTTIP